MIDNNSKEVHVYDGIQEQNNPMPNWWIWLFILCVIFSALYYLHYASGSGPDLKQEYDIAWQEYKDSVEKNAGNAVETEESLMAFMKSENALQEGQQLFSAKCAICHGASLEGKIGPNLTDNFWTTGNGSRIDLVRVIAKGSPAKGMPPWDTQLKASEIKSVAAFVYSKIGSNPANAKAPEGNEVK